MVDQKAAAQAAKQAGVVAALIASIALIALIATPILSGPATRTPQSRAPTWSPWMSHVTPLLGLLTGGPSFLGRHRHRHRHHRWSACRCVCGIAHADGGTCVWF